uniref:Uncharacterized protein n=1 Tax=Cajanus cajan TaxID=3821 RepID=A0A151SDE3_CAJCA|nr:hypothetical protein KK1_025226 [Cajanus cajan]
MVQEVWKRSDKTVLRVDISPLYSNPINKAEDTTLAILRDISPIWEFWLLFNVKLCFSPFNM